MKLFTLYIVSKNILEKEFAKGITHFVVFFLFVFFFKNILNVL